MRSIPVLSVRGDLRFLAVAIAMLALLVAAEHASAVDRIQRTGMLNGTVRAISGPDADGNRYLGGDFTAFSPWETGAGTVVDASTGAVDPSFPRVAAGTGLAYVYDAEPDGNGGVFIAGAFGEVDGQTRYGLARILADGSVDSSWTAGLSQASATSYINDIELAGGVLYVVGRFSQVTDPHGTGNATTRYNAAAFNAGSGALTSWNPATPTGIPISAIAVGTRAYLGGTFNCVNARDTGACQDSSAVIRPKLAAVDLVNGDIVTAFDAGFPANSSVVETVELASSGDWLYLGGTFTTVGGGTSRTNAAVISTDGNDTIGTWAPNPNGKVRDLAISGSTIYIAGAFDSFAPTGGSPATRPRLAEVSLDPAATAVVGALNVFAGATSSTAEDVRALDVEGGYLYLGGSFTLISGRVRSNAAKISLAGVVDPWNAGIFPRSNAGRVETITSLGSRVLLGGLFTQAGGEIRTHAAGVDEDGYLTDWSVELDGTVNAATTADGKVFVGGSFQTANGEDRNRAAAFDSAGTVDVNWDPNLDGTVNAMTALGSTVYLGGAFQTAGGVSRKRAAAFSTAGVLDPTWNPDFNNAVYAMMALGSTIYVGGDFSQTSSSTTPVTRNQAAAFTTGGALDTAWNPDFNNSVYAMVALGSTIYVGGDFTRTSNSTTPVTRRYAAAFTTGGQLVSTWNPDVGSTVFALSATGSTVYLGGAFANVGSDTRNNVAAVSTAGVLQSWAPNPNGNILALGANPETGTAYLGGTFSSISGGTARSFSSAVSAAGTLLDPWPRLGTPTLYALTVAKQGGGSGTVTSSPAGIDCGATCSYSFRAGRTVTLTAAPAAGSTFAGWGGACSGTGTTCAVTMDQVRSVTAQFDVQASSGASGSDASPASPTTKSSLRVIAARGQGQEVVVSIRASGPGRVSAVGTVAGAGAPRTVVCTAAKQVRAAGVARLLCRLNATGRGLLARQALSVRVAITYRPVSGTTRRAVRTVRLAQLTPSPTPVTG